MELDMTKGRPFSLVIKFIIPLIIGNVFQQFYNMVDTIIVGRFVGVQALAAVGATGTIMFLIIGFMQGLTTGFTVLTSQRYGAGDMEAMKHSVGVAAWLSVIITAVMTVISVAGMDWLLTVMRTPKDIYAMSRTYIVIICMGMGCNILYNLLASVLRAVGNSKVPLYFLIVSAVTNIFLDLLFIVVFKMGVAGAALATVIAQGLSGVLCLLYMGKKVPVLKLERRHVRFDSHVAKLELFVGLPMAVQFSITAVGTIIVQAALNMLGSTVVAAYTAASKVEQVVTQPFAAMGMTMATYAGQNRGINAYDRIRQGAKTAFLMSGVYAAFIYVVCIFSMPYLVRLFVSENLAQIQGYAQTYIIICGSCFLFLGVIFIYRNVLQGCGFALMPTLGGVMELISRCVAAGVAAHFYSYKGVCTANALAWVSAGMFLWIAYRRLLGENKTRSKSKPVKNQKGI